MFRKVLSLLVIPFIMMACHRSNTDDHGHSHGAEDDGHSHSHASENDSHSEDEHLHEDVNLTLYSEGYELYVVSPAYEANVDIELLIHITHLADYKPVENAIVSLKVLNKYKRELFNSKANFSHQGMYTSNIRFEEEGEFALEFSIETNKDPIVFKTMAHVGHSHGEAPHGDISFTKELAWKTRFRTMELIPSDFSMVVKTSGEMLPARGDFQAVTALSSGFVSFSKQSLDNGTFVKKNQNLFRISGQGLSENNIENRFASVSNQYQVSKSNYLRKKALFDENIVSARDFETAKAKYNTDSVMYFTLLKSFTDKGLGIKAPISGNVYQLDVSDGDFVEEGQILAHVVANNKLRIHADLPQKHYELVSDISSVQFRPSFSEEVYSMEELNGKLISKGSYADLNAGFIPIIFEVENKDFLAGAYAECWLLTKSLKNQLVIPRSALIEEQGNYYVFVQVTGESFEKRSVQFDSADGKSVSITYGLSFGERIVNEGAMILKVASMSNEAPVHSH